jgi:hypothetical protein
MSVSMIASKSWYPDYNPVIFGGMDSVVGNGCGKSAETCYRLWTFVAMLILLVEIVVILLLTTGGLIVYTALFLQ